MQKIQNAVKVQNKQIKPQPASFYGQSNFWQNRYTNNKDFYDWYSEFPELRKAFDQYELKPSHRILMVGCGNSKLSQQMYQAGFTQIHNIDISVSVIKQMKELFPAMSWEVMDACNMKYQDGYFNCVIDKGTLDALVSGQHRELGPMMLSECMRVTKKDGQLIVVSYGGMQERRSVFQRSLRFDEYDYFQCKVSLSDMSLMIGLIQKKLQGKTQRQPQSQKQAIIQAKRQLALIKFTSKNRVYKKQYINWPIYNKLLHQDNPEYKKEIKIEQTVIEKQILTKQKIFIGPRQVNGIIKSKMQLFVFAYSIRRKFIQNYNEIITNILYQPTNYVFSETNKMQSFTKSLSIQVSKINELKIYKILEYLQKYDIPHPCVLINKPNNQIKNKWILKFCSLPATKLLVFRKNNVQLQLKLKSQYNLASIISMLSVIKKQIISKFNLYPNPTIYQLFSNFSHSSNQTINQNIQKYWFPTFKLNSYKNQQINILFSFPPCDQSTNQQIIKLIKFKIQPYCRTFIETKLRFGFIWNYSTIIWRTLDFASLSYNGTPAELILQDFWEQDQLPQIKHFQLAYQPSSFCLLLNQQKFQPILAHLLGHQ